MRTLRGRVALWSAGIVTAALVLFGAGAAWNLRDEMVENLDGEIRTEAHDFFSEMKEQGVDWQNPRSVEALFDQSKRYHYVEIHDATGRLLYRSANLENQQVLPAMQSKKLRDISWRNRTLRVGVFESSGLILALGKDTEETAETLDQLLTAYLLALPLVVVATGFGSWWIARRAIAPVRAIASRAEQISASDLHQRLPASSAQDEIGHLSRVLDQMFDRLQRSFEQVTRFTSDASHELKTPLALMRAEIESALDSSQVAADQRELLSDLTAQCSQLSQIVDGLLLLSRADDRRLALEQKPVDLVRLVRELMEDAEILAEPAGLNLQCDLPSELIVCGDRRLLARALMNLIDNAIKHNHSGGTVALSASMDGKEIGLTIRNTGLGLPSAAHERIFERFYRSELSRNDETPGHGLGLSIAREIARAHGGDVILSHSDSEWTELRLILPIEKSAALGSTG